MAPSSDRELLDVFDIQEEIATEIANQLKLELGLGVAGFIEARRTDSPDAYTWYVRGRSYDLQGSLENNINKVRALQKAMEFDPEYVLALVDYALSCLTIRTWGVVIPGLCDPSAEEAARKAIEIAPNSIEAQVISAYIDVFVKRDMASYRAKMALIMASDPRDPQLLWSHAYLLCMTFGEYDECFRLFEKIYESEPLDVNTKGLAGEALMRMGRIDEARKLLEGVLAFDPDYPSNYYRMAYLQANYLGDYAEGFRNQIKNIVLDPGSVFIWNDMVQWCLELGAIDMAKRYILPVDAAEPDYLTAMSLYFLALYENDRPQADELSQQLGKIAWAEDDFQWFYYSAWLLDFQRLQPDAATDVYRRLYPNLMRATPVVGHWNQGAAITLAVRKLEDGDEAGAKYLLDQVLAIVKDDANAFISPSLVAIHVLNGNKKAALQEIRELIRKKNFNAWWLLERVSIFEPLWAEPAFRESMSEIRGLMAGQLKNVRDAEAAGKYGPLPEMP